MISQSKVSTAAKRNGRTAARIANLRKVLDALREGDLLRDEIGAILRFGPSGVRRYIKELRENAVIEIARYVDGTSTFLGYPQFQLSPNTSRVDEFIAELDSGRPVKKAGVGRPSHLELAQRDQGRHFHILADDTHYAIRVSRTPIARDPLVAALFGAPRAQQHQAAA